MIPKLTDIVLITALVRCLNSGQSMEKVSAAAKLSPQQIRGKLRAAGFRRVTNSGKWVVG